MTLDEFDKEKEFIKQLSAALNHSPQGSRVAILLYASYSRIASRLGIIQTSELLASSLDGLTPLVGLRRMDRALEYASTAFDNKQPDVRKVVVLLTAGPQSRGGKPLDQAVQPLRTIDAELYVVGIGSRVEAPEITSIVKRKQDVFIVPTFNGLISRVKPIADYIIHGMCYYYAVILLKIFNDDGDKKVHQNQLHKKSEQIIFLLVFLINLIDFPVQFASSTVDNTLQSHLI